MPKLTIDGQIIETEAGTTVFEAARSAGIAIPNLCYHKDLSSYGGCRLCILEVKGEPRPVTAF